MKWLPIFLSVFFVSAFAPAMAADGFSMKPYKKQCDEVRRPYASCLDQTKILADALTEAHTLGKRVVLVFGFNDCAPCNVLAKWLETEEGMALLEPYVLVKVSIFDPERDLRPEVYDTLIPSYNLPINNSPPFGVPHLVVIDPLTNKAQGEGLIGFDYDDQTKHIAYLQESAGDIEPSIVMEKNDDASVGIDTSPTVEAMD